MSARALVTLLALTLAGCSTETAGTTPSTVSGADPDADVTVEMHEMRYEPTRLTVSSGETVTVHLHNAGSLRHDLTLPDGTASETLNADESATMEIGPLTRPVTAWCSIPGHRNAGMELEIVVE